MATSLPAIPDLATTVDDSNVPSPAQTHLLPAPFHLSSPSPTLLTQGAEALVYRTTFLDSTTPAALKFRPSKPYRHPTLDARLTKQRVLAEARVLVKLSGLTRDGISVPAVLSLEWDVARKVRGLSNDTQRFREQKDSAAGGAWILMEWIEGKTVKQLLREYDAWVKKSVEAGVDEASKTQAEEEIKKLLRRIGKGVAAMHSKGGVVHGDLTSSNIMIRPFSHAGENGEPIGSDQTTMKPPDMNGQVVMIDFGLALQSVQDEDRAVDLYVLERAFGSTHPRQEAWFDAEVLQSQDGYRGSFKGANVVLKRLEDVRLRGRKRSMIG